VALAHHRAAADAVPPDVIRELSATYGTSKPASIKIGTGLTRTFHGYLNARAVLALGAVTGNVGIHGGGASGWARGYSPLLNTGAVIAADDRRSRRIHVSTGNAGAVTGKPYPIKAWLVFGNNPLGTMPNPNVWFEKILPGLSFIVVTDIVESWTARYADILLPGTTIYERSDIYTALGCAIQSQQAIAPLYETKSDIEICREMAKRLGFGEHFTNSTDEYIEIMLDHPSLEGVTLAELNQNGGIVRAKEPPEPMVSFADKKFPSRSGRIQLYADYLKDIGEELPLHKESPENSSPAASRYPLRFYTGRRRFWTQSMSYYPLARELNPEPRLRINSIDAREHGIRSEDRVRVFNDRGSFVLKAKVSEVVRPGSIWVEHGWGPQDFEEGHYQNLLLPLNLPDERMINPAFQIFWGMFQKFAETAPSPGLAPYGLADQLFDCLVEVEKI
jgi:anaerobic selenocysteine-containing dehydrogenase